MALLSDGNLRWNRHRSNEILPEDERTPPVFAHGLLEEARRLHQRLSGNTAHPNLQSASLIKPASALEESLEDWAGMHEQGGSVDEHRAAVTLDPCIALRIADPSDGPEHALSRARARAANRWGEPAACAETLGLHT